MSQRLEVLCPALLPGFQPVPDHFGWLLQNQDGCECKALFYPSSTPVQTHDSFNSFPNPAKFQGTQHLWFQPWPWWFLEAVSHQVMVPDASLGDEVIAEVCCNAI